MLTEETLAHVASKDVAKADLVPLFTTLAATTEDPASEREVVMVTKEGIVKTGSWTTSTVVKNFRKFSDRHGIGRTVAR